MLQRLEDRKSQNLYRHRKICEAKYSFISNDYLGLKNDARVKQAFKNGVDQYGVGSGASYLVSGYTKAHQALEFELAEFLNCEQVLLFSTGYMANVGIITSLMQKGDGIFQDKLNHASLIDGVRFSGSDYYRFAHKNLLHAEQWLLKKSCDNKLIVSDGVFSVDGDQADVNALVQLSKQHDALLMIDDAHGIGVLGDNGQGSTAGYKVDLLVGTFGKAFGCFGAFVAGSKPMIETLIQFARSYIYTTAFPPAIAEACRASLQIIKKEQWRRDKLQGLIEKFKESAAQKGVELLPSDTPIQAIVIGDVKKAIRVCESLESQGIAVGLMRPPTVAKNSSRLRVTLSVLHEEEDVENLLEALTKTL